MLKNTHTVNSLLCESPDCYTRHSPAQQHECTTRLCIGAQGRWAVSCLCTGQSVICIGTKNIMIKHSKICTCTLKVHLLYR